LGGNRDVHFAAKTGFQSGRDSRVAGGETPDIAGKFGVIEDGHSRGLEKGHAANVSADLLRRAGGDLSCDPNIRGLTSSGCPSSSGAGSSTLIFLVLPALSRRAKDRANDQSKCNSQTDVVKHGTEHGSETKSKTSTNSYVFFIHGVAK